MSKIIWKLAVLVFASLTIIAEGPPTKPTLPIVGKLEYVVTKTLEWQPATLTRTASLAGERCYSDAQDVSHDYQFVFDDDRDKVTVTINDSEGVKPGRTFTHRLFFKRSDGTVKDSFTLVTETPFSAPGPVHIFVFNLAHGAADPNLQIDDKVPVGGFYEFGQSDRDLAVDLAFDLKTDIGYSSVCPTYN